MAQSIEADTLTNMYNFLTHIETNVLPRIPIAQDEARYLQTEIGRALEALQGLQAYISTLHEDQQSIIQQMRNRLVSSNVSLNQSSLNPIEPDIVVNLVEKANGAGAGAGAGKADGAGARQIFDLTGDNYVDLTDNNNNDVTYVPSTHATVPPPRQQQQQVFDIDDDNQQAAPIPMPENCPICMQPLRNGANVAKEKCGHYLHHECIWSEP